MQLKKLYILVKRSFRIEKKRIYFEMESFPVFFFSERIISDYGSEIKFEMLKKSEKSRFVFLILNHKTSWLKIF